MSDTNDRILHLDAAIEICPIMGSVHPRTLRRWEQMGQFPARLHINHIVFGYSERELIEFQNDPAAWQERHKTNAA